MNTRVNVQTTAPKSEPLHLQPILKRGTILNRIFEIEGVLGIGNAGTVYLCSHLGLNNRKMAVKIISRHLTADPEVRQQLIDEIVATYEVSHPSVVRTFEYFDDGSNCGFSMEYVSGGDLLDFVSKYHPVPFDVARQLLIRICIGLEAIHKTGIVHRDMKPENILITEELEIKIADFGIATHLDRARLLQDGNLLGALDYMSPEYIRNGSFDLRTDIYSLGALAFKLISGRAPFEGYDPQESLLRRVKYRAKLVNEFRIDCPQDLVEIIDKALARNPDQRYRTVQEFRADLELHAPPEVPETPTAPSVSVQTQIKVLPPTATNVVDEPNGNIMKWLAFVFCGLIIGATARAYPYLKVRLEPVLQTLMTRQKVEQPPVTIPTLSELSNILAVQSETLAHTVKYRGENLSVISSWYTGSVDNWRKLAKANPEVNSRAVSKGQVINIPRELLTREKPMPLSFLENYESSVAEAASRAAQARQITP